MASANRVIARLDIKNNRLIKGVHLEGWKDLGDPFEHAYRYYREGIDEILYLDTVASLYNRDLVEKILEMTSKNIFIPITACGGIRTIDDAARLLKAGADKVAINSGAILRPELITELANRFGSQCVVVYIEAKYLTENHWRVFYDAAREPSNYFILEWIKQIEALGAGEILLTSIDREGTGKGFDLELLQQVSSSVSIPVIASGGFGKAEDFVSAVKIGSVSAVAIAHALHYQKIYIQTLKNTLLSHGLSIRKTTEWETV